MKSSKLLSPASGKSYATTNPHGTGSTCAIGVPAGTEVNEGGRTTDWSRGQCMDRLQRAL